MWEARARAPRRSLRIAASLVAAVTTWPAEAATVWSGYGRSFSKPDWVDHFSSQWQDEYLDGLAALTRVDEGGGLINVARETSYDKPTSPAGTLWAFLSNNSGKTVSAANWADLSFAPWRLALGGNANGGPPGTVGQPSVVRFVKTDLGIADDLYIDVRVTGWTRGLGGGFSYERGAGPDAGDYDVNGSVDGLDLAVWMAEFSAGAGLYADGDRNGVVDGADVLVWQQQLGAGAAAVSANAATPEPATLSLCVIASAAIRQIGGRMRQQLVRA